MLYVGGTAISDQSIRVFGANHGKLEWLGVNDTRITDQAVPDFVKMPPLKSLNLDGTGVTESGLHAIRTAHPKASILPRGPGVP
jgi:hypothetical protein